MNQELRLSVKCVSCGKYWEHDLKEGEKTVTCPECKLEQDALKAHEFFKSEIW